MKEVTIIGASLEESVKVRCEVDADPSEVDFVWEFNNSGENFEVAPAKFDGNNGTTSELVYTPESERDYGALTCWGRNAIGKQEAPCIYQVIPAGDTPYLDVPRIKRVGGRSPIALLPSRIIIRKGSALSLSPPPPSPLRRFRRQTSSRDSKNI